LPPLSTAPSTPLQERILANLLVPPCPGKTPVTDPEDKAELIAGLRATHYTDEEGVILCDDILEAALRRAYFFSSRAHDYLWSIQEADAEPLPFASAPGQDDLVFRLTPPPEDIDDPPNPALVPLQIDALRELQLADRNGYELCDEVLHAALVSARYDVHVAAEYLLALLEWPCEPMPYVYDTEREEAIDGLRCIFRQLSWSNCAKAYDEATLAGNSGRAVYTLMDVAESADAFQWV
jgi:hypothetical protein